MGGVVFMGSTLTFDDILNLPEKILKISFEYEKYSILLRENIVLKYYHKNLKEQIMGYFNRFQDIKYSYPMDFYLSTPVIQNVSCKQNTIADSVGKFVARKVDDDIWLNQFYLHLLNLATKLVSTEATYLVDTFFAHCSEEIISEKIGVCRATLQKIKKSCLVKMFLEFRFIEESYIDTL